VECYCQALLREQSLDLEGPCVVVPHIDRFVSGTGDDQLLADADVQSSNLILME
jgi:hypothetical protein